MRQALFHQAKELFFCLLFLSLFGISTNAQYSEFGIAAGFTNYQGDISDPLKKDNIVIGQTRAAFGVLGKYNFNRFFALRGSLMKGRAAGYDSKSDKEERIRRNLHFETDIVEASAIIELNLFGFDPVYNSKRFSPYLFVGAAGFYFNPRAELNGRLVALQPLGLEGQGLPGNDPLYSRFQLAIPGGGGIKFAIDDEWFLGIELGGRKIFTDYLDDVSKATPGYTALLASRGETAALLADRRHELTDASPASFSGAQRGNEKFVDWYYFSVITLTRYIDGGGNGRRRGANKNIGCPTF